MTHPLRGFLLMGLALAAAAPAGANELWDMHGGFAESFMGQDGAALHFQVGEALDAKCKATLEKPLKKAMGGKMNAEGMPGLKAWHACHGKMVDKGFQILLKEVHAAGDGYGPGLQADQKRWAAAAQKICNGKPAGMPRLTCDLRQRAFRFGQLNAWYYEATRSNPEGIYPTEHEWVWEMDMVQPPPGGLCLVANETINVRKAPLVQDATGAITGKLKGGDVFKGQLYLGRQRGPCKQWVYGHGPRKLRGFACLRLGDQTLMKACP